MTMQLKPSLSLDGEKRKRKERNPLSDIRRKRDTVFIPFLEQTPLSLALPMTLWMQNYNFLTKLKLKEMNPNEHPVYH